MLVVVSREPSVFAQYSQNGRSQVLWFRLTWKNDWCSSLLSPLVDRSGVSFLSDGQGGRARAECSSLLRGAWGMELCSLSHNVLPRSVVFIVPMVNDDFDFGFGEVEELG